MTTSPSPSGSNPLRWFVIYLRGMIYDQHTRRLTMFYAVLVALFMSFFGVVWFWDWLRENLRCFVVYWLVVGWLTVLSALLAVYDLLMLRVQHRLVRRHLRDKVLSEEEIERLIARRREPDREE